MGRLVGSPECRHLPLLIAIAAMAWLAPPARAQPDLERTAAARALFHEGMRYVAEGRVADAADRLRRSLELRPSAVVAFNLSTTLLELGQLVEASERLRVVLRDEGAPRPVREAAQERLASLEPRLGRLTVRVDGPLDGVEVRVDDAPLERALIGVERPVDPGVHAVLALRGGGEIARHRVAIEESGEAEVVLAIPPLPAARIEERHVEERVADSIRSPTPQGNADAATIMLGTGISLAVISALVIVVEVVLSARPRPHDGSEGHVVVGRR